MRTHHHYYTIPALGSRFTLLLGMLLALGVTTQARAINIIFESLANTTHPLILDNTFSFDAENPAFDPSANGLLNILQETESVYEDAFEDAGTIRITYWWDADMSFCCGQSIPAMMFENPTGTLTHAVVRFNPTVAYYIDPTPSNDSEYNMQQTLYNFAGPNALSPAQQTARFSGNVPDQFEAGYNGAVVPGSAADGGLRDLLTLAFQEVGHSLGMNAGFTGVTNGSNTGEVDDGDYDVNTSWVNGNVMQMLPRGTSPDPLDHLAGNDTVMGSLSIGSERTRPSAADYFAIALSQGWTNIDLPRQDFLGGGDWNNGFNWMGGQVPQSLDAAYVRHGSAVTLSGLGNVVSLLVDNDSSVQTGVNTLVADDVIIQKTSGTGTPRILVGNFGDLISDNVTVDNGARLDVFGGAVEAARINILPGGELRGNGTVDLPGIIDEMVNDGIIRGSGGGTLVVTSGNNLAVDLDGEGEVGEVIATAGDIDLQAGLQDAFNSDMTIGAGRFVNFGSSFSLGSGGLVLLQGSNASPADLTGSLLFLNPGGVVRADGRGDVSNTVFLSGIMETQDANSELRLDGATYFTGGGIYGPGTARQNGEAFVGQDTEITIDTYDMDGVVGNTVINLNAGSTFTISSPHIDTTADNAFDGTINNNGSTLDIAAAWQLDGVLNLNGTVEEGGSGEGIGPAHLEGAGGLLVENGGRINITHEAFVETAVQVNNGMIFVDGVGEFSGPTTLGVNADVEINNANDSLRLRGNTVLIGPTFVGSGRVIFEDDVNVAFLDTSIGVAETDLDGLLGNTQVLVNSGLTFSIASITIEPTANDGFDGLITNRGTFSVLAGWRLDGQLDMDQLGGNVPTLAGLGTFRIHSTGTMTTDGDAIVNPPIEVAGTLNIGPGLTQINGTAAFESTANATVASGGELELNGVNTFEGGGYSGAGLIQFNNDTSVNSNTTIATAQVDLDGAAENTHLMLNNAALVLNVDNVDESNSFFAGTADVTGPSARLEVNLSNPAFAWQVASPGIVNFLNPSTSTVTMLDGSDVSVQGRFNADGLVRLGANASLIGRLQLADRDTDVHFGGGGQNLVFNTAIVDGPGQITIDDGTRMHLEDGTNIGVDVENAGTLGIGFQVNRVTLDLIEPGAATIRGNFSQTTSGIHEEELGGLTSGAEYDFLDITGVARLNGTLDVSLIDGFSPQDGDTFTILTAAGGIFGSYDQVLLPDIPGIGLCVIYSNFSVMLQAGLSGDLNGDGFVGIADLNIVLGAWNQNVTAGAWGFGDVNGDGFVGIEDLNAVLGNWNAGTPPGSNMVPEPAGMLAVCATILLVKRKT